MRKAVYFLLVILPLYFTGVLEAIACMDAPTKQPSQALHVDHEHPNLAADHHADDFPSSTGPHSHSGAECCHAGFTPAAAITLALTPLIPSVSVVAHYSSSYPTPIPSRPEKPNWQALV